jgi:hypothetical protein
MQSNESYEVEYHATVTITIIGGRAWAHVEFHDSDGASAECWKGTLPIESAATYRRLFAGMGEYLERWNQTPEPF